MEEIGMYRRPKPGLSSRIINHWRQCNDEPFAPEVMVRLTEDDFRLLTQIDGSSM
jgi:hypothetical protein